MNQNPGIRVHEWWDVFTFHEDEIECPDCEARSGPLRDMWAAVRWVDRHYQECTGGRPMGVIR